MDSVSSSENLYKMAFEASTDGIFEWNLQDNNVYFSPHYKSMLGYEDQEFSNHFDSWKSHVHPDDLDPTLQSVEEHLLGKTQKFEVRFRIRHKNGSWLWILARGKAIFDDNDKPIRVIGSHTDVTQEKLLELELKEINSSLQEKVQQHLEIHKKQESAMLQQSRLAQMGEMISMIAHQWRQPLAAISTTAANLSLKLDLNEYALDTEISRDECKSYFSTRLVNIESYVQSLTRVIDDFRNFYKPHTKPVLTSLDQILSKSLNIIHASLKNDGVEIFYYAEDTYKSEMHDSEMMQVVLNILKNAQDNFQEKNIVSPKLTIKAVQNELTIEDNGGGIEENILENIFDPYFSTKYEKNGTGLGLYMSKMIVEEHHDGKLDVKNTKDGVCFTISL